MIKFKKLEPLKSSKFQNGLKRNMVGNELFETKAEVKTHWTSSTSSGPDVYVNDCTGDLYDTWTFMSYDNGKLSDYWEKQ